MNPWAWLILVLLVAAVTAAAWKGAGRNQRRVTQQHVEARKPFDA